jgi:predicted acylesterase/phospholipase RssA
VTTALVVSGGGSKGAFAVGAIRHIHDERGVRFDLLAGTSTGALIAPFVVTGDLDVLERIYTSVETRDILRPVSLQTAWDDGYVFDTEPLERLVKETIDDDRARRVLESPVPIFLSTVNVQTGRLTYFQTGRYEGRAGAGADLVPVRDRAMLVRAIVASANQPVFMPTVCVQPDQTPACDYMDGGVREYVPLDVAIANGAEEIYAVLHSPPARARAEIERAIGLEGIAARAIALLVEEIGDSDLRLAQLYSDATLYLDAIRGNARSLGLTEDQIARLFAGENPFAGRRAVALHVVRPELPFDCETLEFRPAQMTEWVAWGRRRAREALGG